MLRIWPWPPWKTTACLIPWSAKENGATIIEINTRQSQYTNQITDVFLKGNATSAMARLLAALKENG